MPKTSSPFVSPPPPPTLPPPPPTLPPPPPTLPPPPPTLPPPPPTLPPPPPTLPPPPHLLLARLDASTSLPLPEPPVHDGDGSQVGPFPKPPFLLGRGGKEGGTQHRHRSMEAVVVDVGSKLLKAGFAAPDQDPALIIPTQMKRVAENEEEAAKEEEEMAEDELFSTVVRGFIQNWDAIEDLLHHVFYTRLGWEFGNEGHILFTEPLLTPKAVREQLVQLMFETFNVSGFYASEQSVLSLYAVGRISGCTVDIGHGKIDIAPVCEGAVQHIASKRFEIGGMDLTKLLSQELNKSNPNINISISEVEKIKERFACCSEDQYAFENTQNSCQAEKHTLPDGQVITIQRERFIVGEALFQPSMLGLEEYGVVDQLVRCISRVSSENHRQLLENTVLCGGTASMIGFEERFQKEANLCASSIRPSLVKPPEYMPENLTRNSAWMGGAILAKVVFPQNQHITKGEYDETGPSIVHKKCF